MLVSDVIRRLERAALQETPLIWDPSSPKTLFKLEGGGISYGHKFRSATYVIAQALKDGRKLERVADRSSGSWAMGLAWAAQVAGAKSKFVTVGEPNSYIRAFVEAAGGTFDIVEKNSERLQRIFTLEKEGYWIPDQHNNPSIIHAFKETIGREIYRQLRDLEIKIDYMVAPIGTGGLLAGTAQYLRESGMSFGTVGVDLSSSLIHVGPRSHKYLFAKVRGVGSDDEYCGTLIQARSQIDKIVSETPFKAWKKMISFTRSFSTSVGMSSALALAATETLRNQVGLDKIILVLLPDRGETYADELKSATSVFGDEFEY